MRSRGNTIKCEHCRFLVSGECEASNIPMSPDSDPCDRFKLRDPVETYGDVVNRHRKTVAQVLVGANGKSAMIVLKKGGGIKAESPEEADILLSEYESRTTES